MPITTKYLETHEVVLLTRYFLKAEVGAGKGILVEYQPYSQSPGTADSFGSPSVTTSVIAAAKKRPFQEERFVPVLFACNGEPLDQDRKEKKELWSVGGIIFPIIQEWINRKSPRPEENIEVKESQALSEEQILPDLNFDLHLALCKSNHWTLYVFEFREVNRDILQEFLRLPLLDKKQLCDKARDGIGKIDGAKYNRLEHEQNDTIKKLLGQLYKQVGISYIDSKHHAVPQGIHAELKDFFQNKDLGIAQQQCSYQKDGFTCGDRTARHSVSIAAHGDAQCNLSTQQLRQETMQVLGYSIQDNQVVKKVETAENLENFDMEDDEDAGPSEETLENVLYVILAFIVAMIICLVINHFVTASALTVIGGFWGMFGIAMGGLLVLKFATGVLGRQIDKAEEKQNEDVKMATLAKDAVRSDTLKTPLAPPGPPSSSKQQSPKVEVPRKTPRPPPYPKGAKPPTDGDLIHLGSINTPQ